MTNVIELAKQAGFRQTLPEERCEMLCDTAALERFAKLVRDAAMEEATQKCLKLWDLRDSELARLHAAKCASAIESLKEPTP